VQERVIHLSYSATSDSRVRAVEALEPRADTSQFRTGFARYLRLWSWATVSGIIVGIPVVGLLSRVAMRVLAATSGDAVQGAFSDDAEKIGQITAGGTISFVLIAGIFFGAIGGWLYALLKPLFPADRRRRQLSSAAISTAVGVTFLVKPDGRDFAILRPLWLAVALFAAIAFLFGLLVPIVADRLRMFYENTPLRFPQLLAFAPMLLLLPGFVVLVPGLIVGVIYAWARLGPAPRWLLTTGRAALIAIMLAFAVGGVARIAQLEARDPRPSDFVEPVFD
jgi:hypothetical protein